MTQYKVFCENCNAIRCHDYDDSINVLEWYDSVELCCDTPNYLWETNIYKPKRCE